VAEFVTAATQLPGTPRTGCSPARNMPSTSGVVQDAKLACDDALRARVCDISRIAPMPKGQAAGFGNQDACSAYQGDFDPTSFA
jgi:hypothetical protein